MNHANTITRSENVNSFGYIETLWDYNYWARDRIWPCVESISQADFVRPADYSVGSVHEQVVHMMWAEDVWLHRLRGNPTPSYTAQDYATRPAIWQKWQVIEAGWREYIAALTAGELARTFHMVRANGDKHTHRPAEVLIHVVNHSTDHRAQTLALIASYGGETVEQDIIFYFRDQNALHK